MTHHDTHQLTPHGGIGRFMLGIGAIIEHEPTQTILICQRSGVDYQVGEWEPIYGRLDHHEEILTGLQREIREELGIDSVIIKSLLSTWHFYRGEKSEMTEIYGMTFHCIVTSQNVSLNNEHAAYAWVSPEEALSKITVAGIKHDIQTFINYKQDQHPRIAFRTVQETQDYI